MTILRTFVFITIFMSFMMSRLVRGEVSRLVISVGSYRNALQLFVQLVSWARDSCVSSFQSVNSAGRIKIKELGWI